MNEDDVKEIKMSKLLNKDIKDSFKNTKIKELKTKIYYESYNNDIYSKILNRIGNNVKNYIEINNILMNSTEINRNELVNSYTQSKINEMKNKLMEFFEIDYEGKIFNIYKLLSFSVNYEYNEVEIEKIYKNIPFKFFDIVKEEDYYKILFCYECIEEIIKELLSEIYKINNNFFIHLMESEDFQEGNKGYIFEEMVIDFLSPIKNGINTALFDLPIYNQIVIPKFIPKKNEINIPFLESKIILKKTTYIIKQRIFGGKDVDFAILDNCGEEPILFVFQVSILKKIIFTKEYISKQLLTLKEYLKSFIEKFEVDESNIYFGYIFSFIKKDKKEFRYMIKSCENNKLLYCFYDYTKKCFFDKNIKNKITNISKMVTWPFIIISKILKNVKKIKKHLILSTPKGIPIYQLSDLEKNKILVIIRDNFDLDFTKLTFKETSYFDQTMVDNRIGYTYQYKSLKSKKKNKYLAFKQNNQIYLFNLNNSNLKIELTSTLFDIYSAS